MSTTKETEAQMYRRAVREGRALAQTRNGYLYGVFICDTAEDAAERARTFIGPRSSAAAILTRPIDLLKHLKAHNAARAAGAEPPALPVKA